MGTAGATVRCAGGGPAGAWGTLGSGAGGRPAGTMGTLGTTVNCAGGGQIGALATSGMDGIDGVNGTGDRRGVTDGVDGIDGAEVAGRLFAEGASTCGAPILQSMQALKAFLVATARRRVVRGKGGVGPSWQRLSPRARHGASVLPPPVPARPNRITPGEDWSTTCLDIWDRDDCELLRQRPGQVFSKKPRETFKRSLHFVDPPMEASLSIKKRQTLLSFRDMAGRLTGIARLTETA